MITHSASQGTYEDYHSMVTLLGDTFEEGFLAWGKGVSTAGWGQFELQEIDYNNKTATVIIRNTWELFLQEANENRWGCPFIIGKIIGIFSHAFGVNCWADEKKASYTGHHRFVEVKVYRSDKTIEDEIKRLRLKRIQEKERKLSLEIEKKTAQILSAQKELEDYSINLEKKVTERTMELKFQR